MTVDEFRTTYPRLAIDRLPDGFLKSLLDDAGLNGSLQQFMAEMAKLNAGYGIHSTQFAGAVLLALPTDPPTLYCGNFDRNGSSVGDPVTIVGGPDGWRRLR